MELAPEEEAAHNERKTGYLWCYDIDNADKQLQFVVAVRISCKT